MPSLDQIEKILKTPYPLLLSAKTPNLTNNAIVSPVDSSFLANPTRQAMFVDEIRFSIPTGAGLSGTGTSGVVVMPFTGCRLSMGRLAITNGFVPLVLFGKSLNTTDVTNGGSAQSGFCMTWKLPKPLYVPPGEFISPRFQFILPITPAGGQAVPDPTPFQIEMSIVGRSLPVDCPVPRTIDMPWISFWQSKALNCTVSASSTFLTRDQSRETDLVNPFNTPLFLQRLVGRLPTVGANANGTFEANDAGFCFIGSEFVTLRMVNSYGGVLVKDFTPFYDLFHLYDKAWTVNTKMPPKTFLTTFLECNTTTSTQTSTQNAIAMIGMIGYRKVRLAA